MRFNLHLVIFSRTKKSLNRDGGEKVNNLFLLTLLVGLGSLVFSGGRATKEKFSKKASKRHDNKKLALCSVGATVISIVGFGMTTPSTPVATTTTSVSITEVAQSTTDTSAEKLALEKAEAEELKRQKEQAEKDQKEREEVEEKTNSELADLTYDGENQTVDVNDGKPTFTSLDLEITDQGWEEYGDLDELNRATNAEALLNQELMPTEKRKSIQDVKPTGWKNKKIEKGYLYNRTHLIGFALSGENDNWKNLITATQQLNNPEMLRFEMDIKTYLEEDSENYVRYSVVPIFKENELVARGVHIQAQAIDSEDISFNVFIHNIQKDVTINYADGSSETKEDIQAAKKAEEEKVAAEKAKKEQEEQEAAQRKAEEEKKAAEAEAAAAEQVQVQQEAPAANDEVGQTVYVAPQSGRKYHYDANCRGLSNANSVVSLDINEAIAQGYTLCGWED